MPYANELPDREEIIPYMPQRRKDYTIRITKTKVTTVFSDASTAPSVGVEKTTETKKISSWLEKLHIQGEKVRKDDNRREEQAKADESLGALGKPAQLTDQLAELSKQPTGKKEQILTQSGINEHTKNIATKKEDDIEIVNDLVKKSNRSIISISSLFPWDFFPSTIDVEESRVTFTFKQFLTSQSHSVDIKDISNVFIETSMFFASLQLVSRTFVQNDIKIGNLNKADAKKVQGIIEGLRTFAENNVNTANYGIEELIAKIAEFHTSDATPRSDLQ